MIRFGDGYRTSSYPHHRSQAIVLLLAGVRGSDVLPLYHHYLRLVSQRVSKFEMSKFEKSKFERVLRYKSARFPPTFSFSFSFSPSLTALNTNAFSSKKHYNATTLNLIFSQSRICCHAFPRSTLAHSCSCQRHCSPSCSQSPYCQYRR